MAISAQLIGSLGAGQVTESRFWFSRSRKYCSDLDKTWDIPAGRHLLFWQGTRSNSNAGGTITIDGTTFDLKSGITGGYVGGYMYVDGPKTVAATGSGSAGFVEDPYMSWVKVAS
ncbi:gp23 [Corynebacterium phage BFK20]|uniref:Gp23 n=1 Tax=Corynebacterium phage BFK20 TaxID=28358 RepID=Q9MBI1_9CAUD|nr:gp23 [Corynebacterium phage BFK20]CAB93929.2 gp23 [Corynebacterium phage BFK20]